MSAPIPRGRDSFHRYRRLLYGLSAALGIFPRRVRLSLWRLVEGWSGILGMVARYCLLRTLARSCGDNVMVSPHVELQGAEKLVIGDNVSIHRFCYIDATGGVTIGND